MQSILPELGPAMIEGQLDAVQQEVNSLRGELDLLRRRDETLNYYMQRLDEELRLAARLQQDFLPKSLPSSAGCGSTRSTAPPVTSAATSTT